MGSGHILVYAFDVLMQIYEAAGYTQREAAKSILENNIYGLDIDDRAFQLAYFAVMMKARQYNRRILNGETVCHVYSIQESNTVNRAQLKYFGAGLNDLERNDAMNQITGLLDTFVDAKEYGSILNVDACNWDLLRRFVDETCDEGQMSLDSIGLENTKEQLRLLIDIGQVVSQKYDVVFTNPPYMGGRSVGSHLADYLQNNFSDAKNDMFAVFIERCNQFVRHNGYCAMITMHAFMFLSSFEQMRKRFLLNNLINMVHLGIKAFDEIGNDVVQTTTFVFRNSMNDRYKSLFCRLVDCKDQELKRDEFLAHRHFSTASISDFKKIPGSIMAYWVSDQFINNFVTMKPLDEFITMSALNKTGDNETYLRCWWEVDNSFLGDRWRFYAKGGDFRRYYGNLSMVINWSESARNFYKTNKTSNLLSEEFWFREGITYSAVTSRGTGFRYLPSGCVYDMGGPAMFVGEKLYTVLALLNSSVASYYFGVLNPTINLQTKDIKSLPVVASGIDGIDNLSKENVRLSKEDWDRFETSADFQGTQFSCGSSLIQQTFTESQVTLEKASASGLCRIMSQASGRHSSASAKKKSEVMQTRIISPL
jgi:hypothetical protein